MKHKEPIPQHTLDAMWNPTGGSAMAHSIAGPMTPLMHDRPADTMVREAKQQVQADRLESAFLEKPLNTAQRTLKYDPARIKHLSEEAWRDLYLVNPFLAENTRQSTTERVPKNQAALQRAQQEMEQLGKRERAKRDRFELISRIARHLGIQEDTLVEFNTRYIVYGNKTSGVWRSHDYPGLSALSSVRLPKPLYWDDEARTFKVAWEEAHCDVETCCKSTPSGLPYGPCDYCDSLIYHPDTRPRSC